MQPVIAVKKVLIKIVSAIMLTLLALDCLALVWGTFIATPIYIYKDTHKAESEPVAGAYYASSKSTLFHADGCRYVARISDDNLIVYEDREDAIEDGKRPCDICKP